MGGSRRSPIDRVGVALAKIAIGAKHLKVGRLKREVGEFRSRFDMIDVEGIAWGWAIAAAFASPAVRSDCRVPDLTPGFRHVKAFHQAGADRLF